MRSEAVVGVVVGFGVGWGICMVSCLEVVKGREV